MGNNISGTVYPPACEMIFGGRPLKKLLAGSGVVDGGGGGGGDGDGDGDDRVIFYDCQGNPHHALSDYRATHMLDAPHACHPGTKRYYPKGGPPTFLGLSSDAQKKRMAAWNAALVAGLVKWDPKMGMPPAANNADAAAGTGQVALPAAAPAVPPSDPAITELLSQLTVNNTNTTKTQQQLADRQDEHEGRLGTVEGNQLKHAEHMTNLAKQMRTNDEYYETRFASLQGEIDENKVHTCRIETTVKTMGGDIELVKTSNKNLEIVTNDVADDVGAMFEILTTTKSPRALAGRFAAFTPKSTRNFSALDYSSPSSQAPTRFGFEDEDVHKWTSSPPGLERGFIVGTPTNPKNFKFDESLPECFDDFGKEEKIYLILVGGSAQITKDDGIDNSGLDIKGPDDTKILSILAISCQYPPTKLIIEEHTPDDCLPIIVPKSFAEAGLQWTPRVVSGRATHVLEPASGRSHSEETMSKMRLLVGGPTKLVKSIKDGAHTAEFATVTYVKAMRDADDKVIEVDGEVQYGEKEDFLFSKGGIESQVKDEDVHRLDVDAVVASAKMNLDMQDAHFGSQTLAQQTAIYETIEEIAAASSAGTTVGHVRKAMDEMKIAQIFPSNLNYGVLGITKTLKISSNNCEADKFYPEDTKPAVNPVSLFKWGVGNAVGEDGKPFKTYGQQACEADVFYPTDDDVKPAAVDPFAGWKEEGHGLDANGNPIRADSDDDVKPAAVDPFAGWKEEGHGLDANGNPIRADSDDDVKPAAVDPFAGWKEEGHGLDVNGNPIKAD